MAFSHDLAELIARHRETLALDCERRLRPLLDANAALGPFVREILAQLPEAMAGGALAPSTEAKLGRAEWVHACAAVREAVLRLAEERGANAVRLAEVIELNRVLDRLLESGAARAEGHLEPASEAQARVAEAFRSALDGIVTIDEHSRVLAWNPAAEDIFGIRGDEAVGRLLPDLIIPPEQRAAHREGLKRYLATGQARLIGRRVEVEALRVDGSRIPVELAITGTEVGGKKTFVGFLRDISARKEADREREQMVGVLSHDLRTPLTAVAVSAGTLLRDATLTEGQRRAVTRIVGSAERMRRMINDLLDVTQIRLGGGLSISRAPTDLAAIARQVLDEFRVINPGRTLKLEVSGDCRGRFDADRISQALNNLVQNAVLHGSGTSEVGIAVRCGPEEALLEVSNDGPDIPPSVMSVIWEPFRRGQADAMKRSGGLGLGLHIVREIVRAHGGTAAASSHEGKTVFAMRLPLAPPQG